jgi:hypothetical protein
VAAATAALKASLFLLASPLRGLQDLPASGPATDARLAPHGHARESAV